MAWYTLGGNVVIGPIGAIMDSGGGPPPNPVPPLVNDLFPRSVWVAINPGGGSGSTYAYANSAFQTAAAKFNVVIVGPYMGIEQTMGNTTFATIFTNIKNKSTVNGFVVPTRCLEYVMSQEQSTVGGGGNSSTYTVWSATVQNTNWWIRTSYPGGSIVTNDANSGLLATTSQNNIIGGDGNTLYQDFWKHYDGVLRQGNAVALGYTSGVAFVVNANLDGYEMDNMNCSTPKTGAWGMDTTSYAAGNSTASAWLQQAQALHVAALKAINPDLLVLGNLDYYVHSTSTFSNQVTLDPAQNGIVDLVLAEGAIGAPSGIEGAGASTTLQFINNLIGAEAQIATNGTLVLMQSGTAHGSSFTSNTNQSSWTSTDWQAARFGLAIACMRNYHFSLSPGENYAPTNPIYMDEYLSQSGSYGWLGAPIDSPQTASRTSGVWYRTFQNGTVFMNPKGNGSQTITLSSLGITGQYAIANVGYGDATINTGQPVSSITLSDRDGRFLIRTGNQLIIHGELFTLTGSGFGTRPNYNFGGYTWKGQTHMHAIWNDFSETTPPTPSGNTNTDWINWKAANKGLYPLFYPSNGGAPAAPRSYALDNAGIVAGGPSYGGMMWKKGPNTGAATDRYGGLYFIVSGTPPSVSNVSTSYPGEYTSCKFQQTAPGSLSNTKCFRRSYNFNAVPISGSGNANEYILQLINSNTNMEVSPDASWGNPLQSSLGSGAGLSAFHNQVDFVVQFNRLQMWTDASGNFQFYCNQNPPVVWVYSSVAYGPALPMWFGTWHTPWGAGSDGYWSNSQTFDINDLSVNCLFTFCSESAIDAAYNQNVTDIYHDFTPARVEVTDGTYSEPQILLNWSNTQIQFLGNQGQLTSGAGTLNVYNNSNTVIQSFPVIIG